MKFPQIPLHDLEGATLNFEALQLRDILNVTAENVLQVEGGAQAKISWGLFATGTGTIATAGSGDWSVGTLSAGKATVTYATRAVAPVLLAMPVNNAANVVVQATSVTTSAAALITYTPAAGVLTNSTVCFAVIG